MCCVGCAAAAAAIVGCGLGDYYRFREARALKPSAGASDTLAVYDDPALLERFSRAAGDAREVSLVVAGMTCAACAWLLEQRLAGMDGVEACEVSLATGRAHLRWQPSRTALSAMLAAIDGLGFDARPYTPDARRRSETGAARDLLRRLGVAAICGMQVMMIALALYLGGDDAAADGALAGFLRWAALVLTVPVMAYAAQPFWRSALAALRARRVNMDVPVTLALVLAFGGSAWHTLAGAGAVYYDSVVMFATFLLASRYLELRARVRAAARLEALGAVLPDAARRIARSGARTAFETVPSISLEPGDHLWIRAGEVVPADGEIVTGRSSVDASVLTGESLPQPCAPGSRLLAGSVNLESPLELRVGAVAAQSFAGHLARLVERAAALRPGEDRLGAAVARWFVLGVLVVAAVTAAGWALVDPGRWFAATLAVLVVSCPCALALARPAAHAAAHAALLGEGVAVLGAGALERLSAADVVLFDKTGTLTTGELEPAAVEVFGERDEAHCVALAVALAEASEHPLARALRRVELAAAMLRPATLASRAGRGSSAVTAAGERVCLGSREFVAATVGTAAFAGIAPQRDDGGKEAWLACDGRVVARFEFADTLRSEAPGLIAWLAQHGLPSLIVSGDRESAVAAIAGAAGIGAWHAAMRPADKLAEVERRQAAGERVVMVGDGINDSPVMARADVSIAVADATAPARQQADILLLAPTLEGVRAAVSVAARLRRVVRQNLAWAIAYNAGAVPLAVGGWLPPWAAAIGMSLSSLAVVANALRIRVRR